MRRLLPISSLIAALLFSAISCFASVDPILLDVPNENVYSCGEDVFLEVLEKPTVSTVTAGRTAKNFYLFFKTKMLYLAAESWDGLDKNSFCLSHINEEGNETVYPLDYAATMISNRSQKWNTLSDAIEVPTYWSLNLIFDIDQNVKDGWTLLFTPRERGAEKPYCEVKIPLTVR